jgi:ribonuclease P protein component
VSQVTSLGKRGDISRVLSQGRRVRASGLSISYLRTEAEPVRLVMAVRARSAVKRNRIRRRLRAAVASASLPGGVDLMIRTDESAAGLEFQEMVASIRGAIK